MKRILGSTPAGRNRRNSELDRQFLLRLAGLIDSSSDRNGVLRSVAGQLGRHLQVSRCHFVQVDAAGDRVALHSGHCDGVPELPSEFALSAFGGDIRDLAGRGETLVLEDARVDPRTAEVYAAAYAPASTRGMVAVPLMRDQRWVASLVVSTSVPRVWREREITLVKLVAERAWLWTEHLRVLADLQRTESKFRSLVEDVTEYAIFMLDVHGNVQTWNAGAERLKGYRSEEIVGKPLSIFYPSGDSARVRSVLAHAVRAGRFEEEGWRVRKDGTKFWASVVITPVYGRNGTLEGFAKVARDFTERQRRDHEMRVEQAERLREREVLVQEVDHRVKNNLQVITSLISMQMRQAAPGPARDALAQCRTRVLAIAYTHEQIYQSKDYAKVRFADYVRGLVDQLVQADGGSPDRVALDLAIEEVELGVDRAIPCALVIGELVSNALQHGFAGGRSGTLRVELTSRGERDVCLAVRDDGAGLPPGFDIQNVQSMGLQLVCTLAEQLDATLVATSDRGAAFRLTFAAG